MTTKSASANGTPPIRDRRRHEIETEIAERMRQRQADLDGTLFDFDARIFERGANEIERLRNSHHAMKEALEEAERFLDYFANNRTSFVGGGTPTSALEKVRAALSLTKEI